MWTCTPSVTLFHNIESVIYRVFIFFTDHGACQQGKQTHEGLVSDAWFCSGSCQEVLWLYFQS